MTSISRIEKGYSEGTLRLTNRREAEVQQDAFEMVNSDDVSERELTKNLKELRLKTKPGGQNFEREQVLRYDPSKVTENEDGTKELKPGAIDHYHKVSNKLLNEESQARMILTTTYDKQDSDSAKLQKFTVYQNSNLQGNKTSVNTHVINDNDGKRSVDFDLRRFKDGVEVSPFPE
jgi:hypothetical protein